MKIDEKQLKVTPCYREKHGGQQVGTSDSGVTVELERFISITLRVHRSQLKNKRLAIDLIELALDDH